MADPVNSWYDEVVEPGFNPKHINPFKYFIYITQNISKNIVPFKEKIQINTKVA